jgi:hypothetical protein
MLLMRTEGLRFILTCLRLILTHLRFVLTCLRFALTGLRLILTCLRLILTGLRLVLTCLGLVLTCLRLILIGLRPILTYLRFILIALWLLFASDFALLKPVFYTQRTSFMHIPTNYELKSNNESLCLFVIREDSLFVDSTNFLANSCSLCIIITQRTMAIIVVKRIYYFMFWGSGCFDVWNDFLDFC